MIFCLLLGTVLDSNTPHLSAWLVGFTPQQQIRGKFSSGTEMLYML